MKSHSKSFINIFTVFALLTSLLVSALIVTPASAAALTVNTTVDELNMDGDCSLREAIQAANTDTAVDACASGQGADTINLPAGTYTLTIIGHIQDANGTGDLEITGSLIINGAGAGITTIQAGAKRGSGIDRVFQVVAASTVSISGVTIANGVCTSCNGGGIYNGGTLTVTNSSFSGNSAATYGGGIYNDISSTLTVTNSTFSGNSSYSGSGITNAGTMTVTNSTFSGNSATYGGAGIFSFGGTGVVTNSTFSGNSASDGGGIFNYTGGTLTVTNSTFSGNFAITFGGGIYNQAALVVTNSTFSGNSAATRGGGGIYNRGTLAVTSSTFSGNSAGTRGGGIDNDGKLHLKNTILANSASGADCYNDTGTIATNLNNLIETNGAGVHTCGKPAIIKDPALGALANNGGPTQTFAIGTDSPAYNMGVDAICAAEPVSGRDQRGFTRPQNGICDIGAFESNAQPGPAFVVNTTADSLNGSCDAYVAGVSDCTLREAITAANNLAGADTINVPAGTYTLAITGSGEDVNASGDLDIRDSLTINGAGAGSTIIQAGARPGSGIDRVFDVVGASTVSISGVTIVNGVCPSCNGGGISNVAGSLTMTNSMFTGNSAATYGGGILNLGSLTVTNSTFSTNSATSGGGIYNGGSLTMTNSTFSGNRSLVGGGGILNLGTLTVINNTFSGNDAFLGSGIFNYAGGTLNLSNTILANSASGADCYNDTGTIATDRNNLIETNGRSGHKCGTPAMTSDPNLGVLADNGGLTQTFALLRGSPAIGASDNGSCPGTDQRGIVRPQGAYCDIGAYEYKEPEVLTVTLISIGDKDGWVLESSETSNTGGTLDAGATTFNLGDDAGNRQYRAILHFDSSSLPDNALIISGIVKIKQQRLAGTNPFTTHGGLLMDIQKPYFGTTSDLSIGDFSAVAGQSAVSTFGVSPADSWYSAVINSKAYRYLNLTGTTQFRLSFTLDDNNDGGADTMKFYSGDAAAATRPILIIQYYVP